MGRADRRAVALAGVITLALASGCSAVAGPPTRTVPTGWTQGRVVPSRVAVGPDAWLAARTSAGERLIRARTAALAKGDVRTWLAGVAGGALRAEQEQIFAGMRAMGAGHTRLRSMEETVRPGAAEAGVAVGWTMRATFDYRLRGFDSSPRTFTLDLSFRADPARPAETIILTGSRPGDRPQPWDLPGLVVRRSGHTLVLASGSETVADEIARRAAQAGRRVAAVLGATEPAVWIAPADDAEAAQLLGRPAADLEGIAAAVDGPIAPGRAAGADRIVLVPTAWSALTGPGRDVVMAHELTHATTRRSSLRQPPLWLSEGLAEFIAYRTVDLPERDLVQSAVERLRAEGLPTDLPTSRDFESGPAGRAAAYGLSLLLARTIVEGHGTDGLVRVFRAVNGGALVPGHGRSDAEAVTDHFLRTVLGTDRRELVAAWRSRLSRLSTERP
ncbi:hypothetical protein [Intrasporangium sp. DVR]|uniref:hypothetical protein n=1 Tax=Intrasporangium sp. DVR TaxID=3127867 RepID=UPI00313A571E